MPRSYSRSSRLPLRPAEERVDALDEARFPRTWAALREATQEGSAMAAPGAVVGLWRFDEPDRFSLAAFGRRRLDAGGAEMIVDTIFDLASVTKVFATAALAATLVDRGWLRWDTLVRELLPSAPGEGITIAHLLSHTAGLPAWEPLWERLRDRLAPRAVHEVSVAERQALMREIVLAVRPEVAPGERAVYSDLSFLTLGFALEEVTGLTLDRAVARFVWEPLGIAGAHYRRTDRLPAVAKDSHVAATERSPWHGEVMQGQVHDENCWAMGGYGGHAGAFGTAQDVLRFARGMFTGFLSPRVRDESWRRVESPKDCSRTLGWDTPSGAESSASALFSPRSVGHLGFTGTSLWIDPDARLAVTLLTNRVHLGRENILIRALRPRVHRAIREDLADPAAR